MLKGIPSIISPELLKILMEMGHGDTIVLADGNYPSASMAKRLVRADGHNVPELLEAILKLFPLDTYGDTSPAGIMQKVPGDTVATPIWDVFRKLTSEAFPRFKDFENIERFAFYEESKKAYAIIATGEKALYANIILRKGVVV